MCVFLFDRFLSSWILRVRCFWPFPKRTHIAWSASNGTQIFDIEYVLFVVFLFFSPQNGIIFRLCVYALAFLIWLKFWFLIFVFSLWFSLFLIHNWKEGSEKIRHPNVQQWDCVHSIFATSFPTQISSKAKNYDNWHRTPDDWVLFATSVHVWLLLQW